MLLAYLPSSAHPVGGMWKARKPEIIRRKTTTSIKQGCMGKYRVKAEKAPIIVMARGATLLNPFQLCPSPTKEPTKCRYLLSKRVNEIRLLLHAMFVLFFVSRNSSVWYAGFPKHGTFHPSLTCRASYDLQVTCNRSRTNAPHDPGSTDNHADRANDKTKRPEDARKDICLHLAYLERRKVKPSQENK